LGLIDHLSELIYHAAYDDLPEPVINSTKFRVLDFLGVALTGFKHEIHKPFLKVWGSSNPKGESTLIGEGTQVYCQQAALINSSMCPADLTDGSRFGGLHPSAVVIPAALAVFEKFGNQNHKTGKDLLLGIALGYEIMIRVGSAMNPSAVKRGFHLTPVIGPMGAAAAASKILASDPSKIANSLSSACLLGSGLLDAFKGSESFVGTQISRACEGGVYSALLAREGIKGYPDILEAAFLPAFSGQYDPQIIIQDLGNDFMIPKTYIRKHAGCRHIHAPIDATLSLVGQHQIEWGDIDQILVKTYSVAKQMENDHPQSGNDARFNMAFGIAVALIFGNALYDQFTTRRLNDTRVQNLMKKVKLEVSEALDKDYPSKRGTIVSVKMKAGQTFSLSLDFARGEPEVPLSEFEIEEKFERLVKGILDEEKVLKIKDFVKNIEQQAELTPLFQNLAVRATGQAH
jgi:2-methylcitrate dehydratase PrpD